MKHSAIALSFIACCVLPAIVFSGCGGGSTAISNQDDASLVAEAIDYQLRSIAPFMYDANWTNSRDDGAVSGYAIRNGSVSTQYYGSSYTSIYTYNNVQIQLNDYCGSENYPHLTGDAQLTGTRTESYENGDSGNFTFSGTVSLSGRYTGSIEFEIMDCTGGSFLAILLVDGEETWNVTHM